MPVVQFAQFSSIVQPTFWHELSRLKLEVLRLSEETVTLTATYSTGRTVKDRNTGQEVALGCNIALGGEGLSESYRCVYLYLRVRSMGAHHISLPHLSVPAQGILKNYNTIEEFKNADKRALFSNLSDEVCTTFSVVSTASSLG
jgi:ubiquitin-like modifier-activating enzyme ATG7